MDYESLGRRIVSEIMGPHFDIKDAEAVDKVVEFVYNLQVKEGLLVLLKERFSEKMREVSLAAIIIAALLNDDGQTILDVGFKKAAGLALKKVSNLSSLEQKK